MSSNAGRKMSEPTYDEVLEFVERNSCPFVTTEDVAEQFPDKAERTIRERLKDLADQKRLRKRRVGPHALVWFLPD